jgi:hypothetical protein
MCVWLESNNGVSIMELINSACVMESWSNRVRVSHGPAMLVWV